MLSSEDSSASQAREEAALPAGSEAHHRGRRRSRRRHRHRSHEEVSVEEEDKVPPSRPRTVWLAFVPLLACFFGAGRETWSLGLGAALMGLSLLIFPARGRLPALGWVLAGLVAAAPLAGLLPASWFGGLAGWRQQIASEWSLPLPQSVSVQPAVTLDAWLVMICGLCWLWNCLGQGFGAAERRLALRCLVLGGGALAVLSMLEYGHKISVPWWPRNERSWGGGFGPFANRNHISSLCAMIAVLASAITVDAFRHRSRWWVPAGLSFFACVGAIVMNTSRAGLFLLVIGMAAWLITSSFRRSLVKHASVWIALVMILSSVLLVSKGNLAQRLQTGLHLDVLTRDFRVVMIREVLGMSKSVPVAGIGLGNFAAVFPQMTSLHQPTLRFLHPESDVLWLLLEGGGLLLLACAGLLIWLVVRIGPWRSRQDSGGRSDRRLRRAAGVAGLLALVHACFDVPLHGAAFFMVAGLVFGLGCRPAVGKTRKVWATAGTRLAGVAVLGLGVCWIGISQGKLELPLASSSHQLYREAIQNVGSGQPAAAFALNERAIRLAPFDYALYYLRAQLRLQLHQGSARALQDFGIARAIEPHVANFCYWEGTYWLAYDPILATVPWREWLLRNPEGAQALWGGYRQMVLDAEAFPELLSTLRQMAETPRQKLIFLMAAKPGPEWQKCLDDLLQEAPTLESFSAEDFAFLFGVWLQNGDRERLIRELEAHSSWQTHGWRILADEYARRGEFRRAYELAEKSLPPRAPPRNLGGTGSLESLRRMSVLSPADPKPGMELFYALRAKGENAEALYVLERVAQLPTAPPFLKREWATMMAEKGDFRTAWELLVRSIDDVKS